MGVRRTMNHLNTECPHIAGSNLFCCQVGLIFILSFLLTRKPRLGNERWKSPQGKLISGQCLIDVYNSLLTYHISYIRTVNVRAIIRMCQLI